MVGFAIALPTLHFLQIALVVTQDNKALKRTIYVHEKCRLTSGIMKKSEET